MEQRQFYCVSFKNIGCVLWGLFRFDCILGVSLGVMTGTLPHEALAIVRQDRQSLSKLRCQGPHATCYTPEGQPLAVAS